MFSPGLEETPKTQTLQCANTMHELVLEKVKNYASNLLILILFISC